MAGGILFGPPVGIVTGIVAGVHRYLIDIGGITRCLVLSPASSPASAPATSTSGERAALARRHRRRHAVRILTMLLIVLWVKPTELGLDIVSVIALPMISARCASA